MSYGYTPCIVMHARITGLSRCYSMRIKREREEGERGGRGEERGRREGKGEGEGREAMPTVV